MRRRPTSTSSRRCSPPPGSTRRDVAGPLAERFTEVHPLPGPRPASRSSTVQPSPTTDRAVYLRPATTCWRATSGASGLARRLGRVDHAAGAAADPGARRTWPPTSRASSCEVAERRSRAAPATGGSWCAPSTTPPPGPSRACATSPRRRRADRASGPSRCPTSGSSTTSTPTRSRRATVATTRPPRSVAHLRRALKAERARCVPERNQPWPYADATRTAGPPTETPPPPARAGCAGSSSASACTPTTPTPIRVSTCSGRRALVVCTNHGVLDIGKPTGVFASEMTVPVLRVPRRRHGRRRGQPVRAAWSRSTRSRSSR